MYYLKNAFHKMLDWNRLKFGSPSSTLSLINSQLIWIHVIPKTFQVHQNVTNIPSCIKSLCPRVVTKEVKWLFHQNHTRTKNHTEERSGTDKGLETKDSRTNLGHRRPQRRQEKGSKYMAWDKPQGTTMWAQQGPYKGHITRRAQSTIYPKRHSKA